MAQVMNEGVKCFAHPITVDQCKRMEEKGLDAFEAAPLSDRAKKAGAYRTIYGTGYSLTTSAYAGSSDKVLFVQHNGDRGFCLSDADDSGLRVALHPLYDPESKIMKTKQSKTRTVQIWNSKKTKFEKKTSKGTVVKVGGIEYLWLNEKECKRGAERAMDLVSVELVDRSVPFDREGKNNDYAKATELQEQCEKVALEHCDNEELKLICGVILPKANKYSKWILAPEASVSMVYKDIEAGKMTAKEGKEELHSILNETSSVDVETIESFITALNVEHEIYMTGGVREGKREAVTADFDKASAMIDRLQF